METIVERLQKQIYAEEQKIGSEAGNRNLLGLLRDAKQAIESAQQRSQSDGVWTCVCGELHLEGGVYCDVCGTDRPRR